MAITNYSVRRPSHAPWADFDTNRLARLFDDSIFNPARSGGWAPAVSVSETNDELVLTAELPGLAEDDISLEIENNVLTISGEKADVREEDGVDRRYHVVERSYGSFTRSFTLPRTVDSSNIVAMFENGVLAVTLPKAPEAKGRRIEISK